MFERGDESAVNPGSYLIVSGDLGESFAQQWFGGAAAAGRGVAQARLEDIFLLLRSRHGNA